MKRSWRRQVPDIRLVESPMLVPRGSNPRDEAGILESRPWASALAVRTWPVRVPRPKRREKIGGLSVQEPDCQPGVAGSQVEQGSVDIIYAPVAPTTTR